MAPVVDRLKGQYEGKVEFKLYNVDNDADGQAIAQKYGVQFVPTFVLVNADGSFSDQAVGELDEARLKGMLDALH